MQYESVSPHASDRQLRIAEVAEPPSCTVENRLGADVEFLMLRSAAGDLYFGRDIAVDGRAALEILDSDAAMEAAAIKMINRRNANETDEMAITTTPAAQLFFGSARRNMRMGNSYVVNGSGLLDSELALAFEEVGAHLPNNRTYVAIVGRPPDVEVGMDGLVEQQSLHVIRGSW